MVRLVHSTHCVALWTWRLCFSLQWCDVAENSFMFQTAERWVACQVNREKSVMSCVFNSGLDWMYADTHLAFSMLHSDSLQPRGSHSCGWISVYAQINALKSCGHPGKTGRMHKVSDTCTLTHTNLRLGLHCEFAPVVLFLHSLLNSETQDLRWRKMLNNGILKKMIIKKK